MLARHFSLRVRGPRINRILAAKINPLSARSEDFIIEGMGREEERADQSIFTFRGDFYKSRSSHLSFSLPSSFLLTILRQISRRWHFFFLSIWISRFYFTSLFYPLFTNPKPRNLSSLGWKIGGEKETRVTPRPSFPDYSSKRKRVYDDFFIIRKCGLARGKYFNTAQYSRCKTTLPLSLSPPFSLPPHFFSKDSGETFLIRKAKLNCDCVFTFFLGSKFN